MCFEDAPCFKHPTHLQFWQWVVLIDWKATNGSADDVSHCTISGKWLRPVFNISVLWNGVGGKAWISQISQLNLYDLTRSTHVHDTSCSAVPMRMCALCMRSDYGWIEHKSEHNLYLACEDSPQCAFFLCNFSCSYLPSWTWLLLYIDFVACSFSVLPTVGCVQHSTPQNTYVAEDQPRCSPCPPLSRNAVLPCPLILISCPACTRLHHQCTWRMSFLHVSANECKLAFLSMIRMYVRMYIARIDPSFKALR